ncbi:MAG TPA: histidine phosphatase family protein [Candidatus Binataceae bacterium]|nr:histidine phosphatase family protein [Candidatus Binataceae bacterium]
MGRLILIRHAESEGNAIRVFTTTPESLDLTNLGRRQAALAAASVKEMFQPAKVVTSTFKRARETGRIIAEAIGVPTEIEADLRERDVGELAGQSYDSVLNDPGYEPKLSWLWRPKGGESLVEVMGRAGPVLDRIAARHRDEEIVIVSHGGVMRSLWAHVTGSWEGAHIPPNCGIVLVEHSSGRYHPPRVVSGEPTEKEAGG